MNFYGSALCGMALGSSVHCKFPSHIAKILTEEDSLNRFRKWRGCGTSGFKVREEYFEGN